MANKVTSSVFSIKLAQLTISPVKRDRIEKQKKEKFLQGLRDALPILTRDEIRRHRMPCHEAVITELDTTGYPNAARFLRQLINHQEMLRKEHGPDTVVWNRPELYKSKQNMEQLFQGLRRAERCNQTRDVAGECDELIKLIIHYAFGPDDWWWLGEQLMLRCIYFLGHYEGDGSRRQALTRFIYGKFFFENIKDHVLAQTHLNKARELSAGMPWHANREFGKKMGTIYIETCILLCKAVMGEAEEVMKRDMSNAVKLSRIARKRAAEACYHEGEANALLFKGKCERMLGDTYAAIGSFTKALQVQIRSKFPIGICEARVQLALAFIRHGNTTMALHQLQALMEYAKMNDLQHYIAQAYRYLGMHYVSSGEPVKATALLIKALNLFHQQNNYVDMEQVRNFAAISAAQELLPQYTRLLMRSDVKGTVDPENMGKLVRWKDARQIFWTFDDEDVTEPSTTQSMTTMTSYPDDAILGNSGEYGGVLVEGEKFAEEPEAADVAFVSTGSASSKNAS